MLERPVYCRFCKKRIGKDELLTSQKDLDKLRTAESTESAEKPEQSSDFDKEFLDGIEVERTQKLGIIVKMPCQHCKEPNYFRMYETKDSASK